MKNKFDDTSKEAQQAPGCYGSPTCYASDSKICQQCQAYSTCGSEMLKTLERIKPVVDVEDMMRKHYNALSKSRAAYKLKVEGENKDRQLKPIRSTPAQVVRKTKVENISYEVDESTMALIATLPVKARSFALTLCKERLVEQIKADIKTGNNPLSKTGPKWLAIALSKLLQGGFERSALKNELANTLSWSEQTAASHTSLAVKLFLMFEIAVEENSKLVANPELLEQN